MKKMMLCCFVLSAMFLVSGCAAFVEEKPGVVNNYYFIVTNAENQNDIEYNHKKKRGEAGFQNADHRKQRGRTAPSMVVVYQ